MKKLLFIATLFIISSQASANTEAGKLVSYFFEDGGRICSRPNDVVLYKDTMVQNEELCLFSKISIPDPQDLGKETFVLQSKASHSFVSFHWNKDNIDPLPDALLYLSKDNPAIFHNEPIVKYSVYTYLQSDAFDFEGKKPSWAKNGMEIWSIPSSHDNELLKLGRPEDVNNKIGKLTVLREKPIDSGIV